MGVAGRRPCSAALAPRFSRGPAAPQQCPQALCSMWLAMPGPRLAARWWQQRPCAGRRRQPWEAAEPASVPPCLLSVPDRAQISSAAPFKAPSAAAKPVQAAFRRVPLRIQAARIGGVEVPNQKCARAAALVVHSLCWPILLLSAAAPCRQTALVLHVCVPAAAGVCGGGPCMLHMLPLAAVHGSHAAPQPGMLGC